MSNATAIEGFEPTELWMKHVRLDILMAIARSMENALIESSMELEEFVILFAERTQIPENVLRDAYNEYLKANQYEET